MFFKKSHLATTWVVVKRTETACFMCFTRWIYIPTFIHGTQSDLGKVSPELRASRSLRLLSKGRKWTPGFGPFSFLSLRISYFGQVILTFS